MRKGAAQEKHTRGGVLRKTPQSPSRFPQFQVDWRRNLFILHGHKPCHLEPAGGGQNDQTRSHSVSGLTFPPNPTKRLAMRRRWRAPTTQSSSCCIAARRIESAMRKTGVTVLRDGIETNVPVEEIVPGDICMLNAGETLL
jgi:hypothetical protein